MIIVRTVAQKDLAGVMGLAEKAYPGMTTLPPEAEVLAEKIALSEASVNAQIIEPQDEVYFLVMEDTVSKQIVGTAAIIACLGSSALFYSYKLNKVTQVNRELDKKISFETLNLSNHFEGFAEVATLYLRSDYRKNGNGKLLSRSRYMFMAQFRERFPRSVMADLRGYFDDQGRSPFWDAVGRHFFDMEFSDADLYGAINGNQFIADLMPKHPLYVNMLPESAQKVIGQPNDKGKAALEMLLQEGFAWNGHVDIFDAAPSVDTLIDNVRTVRDSELQSVIDVSDFSVEDGEAVLISNCDLESFSVCQTTIQRLDHGILINPDVSQALSVQALDKVRVCRL